MLVIEVAVCLIEETKVRLVAQKREEVLEGQTEIPSLNMSIFRSCQNALIFSTASRNGTTPKLLYQTKKSLKVDISLSSHTF